MSCCNAVSIRKNVIANTIKTCINKEFYTTFTSKEHWPLSTQTQKDPCRMLILDSSFNPPTKAHANLFKNAAAIYPAHYFDAGLFLFSTVNADKALSGASVLQRAQMMEIMALQSGCATVPNMAVGLTPCSIFVDKAKVIQTWFQEKQGETIDLELHFILGYDTMIRLMDPKYYHGVPVQQALAPFFASNFLICADRNEDSLSKQEFWKQVEDEYNNSHDLVKRIVLDEECKDYSSTMARSLAKNGDANQALDADILEFVNRERIYK